MRHFRTSFSSSAPGLTVPPGYKDCRSPAPLLKYRASWCWRWRSLVWVASSSITETNLGNILAYTALPLKACTLTMLISSNSLSLSILWTRTFSHFLAKWHFFLHRLHFFPRAGQIFLSGWWLWPQNLQEIFFADRMSGVGARDFLVLDLINVIHRPRYRLHLQLINYLAATHVDATILSKTSHSQQFLGPLLVFNCMHKMITDETTPQTITKIECFGQIPQLGNKNIIRLSWELVSQIKTVSFVIFVDFADAMFLHFAHDNAPIIRVFVRGVVKCFDDFQSILSDRIRAWGARALKRAGSSDLAVMQGSGYYQRDKTRWRTLYWTVREIIQRKLAIIPWHSFAASNSEGTNYFFSRSFSVLFNFLPPRTNICI